LTDGKTYVYSDLQKVDPSSIDESSNAIEDAKREIKISKKLKNVGVEERPTFEKLHEAKPSRGKVMDYAKLADKEPRKKKVN
jgi:hypothetical protein